MQVGISELARPCLSQAERYKEDIFLNVYIGVGYEHM